MPTACKDDEVSRGWRWNHWLRTLLRGQALFDIYNFESMCVLTAPASYLQCLTGCTVYTLSGIPALLSTNPWRLQPMQLWVALSYSKVPQLLFFRFTQSKKVPLTHWRSTKRYGKLSSTIMLPSRWLRRASITEGPTRSSSRAAWIGTVGGTFPALPILPANGR